MRSLSEIQRLLAAMLQRPRSLLGYIEDRELISAIVSGNDRLSPAEQLEVYREQFWLRHTGALLEDFPGLSGILGRRAWERLVEGYLVAHPPTHFSLRDLGAELPAYVARQEWLERPGLCLDMARLEWAYIECFDAAEAAPLDPQVLAKIPASSWPGARLSLAPSLRLLRVEYPVAELRLALKRSRSGGPCVAYPAPRRQALVIFRQEGELRHLAVPGAAFELLEQFGAGKPLLDAVETVVASGALPQEDLARSLMEWCRNWAALGWVTEVRVE